MADVICLDKNYSTTRMLYKIVDNECLDENGKIKEECKWNINNSKLIRNPEDKFETVLFLLEGEGRKGEGGLRTKGYFKKSYKNKPLMSIITVVFNGEKYLEETIQSVINQTYDNVEYFIIDGGSTDGTLDIIKKYEDQIDYWVSERDKGISDAFNKGIRTSLGEYILLLNSDDTLFSQNSVEKMELFIKNQSNKNGIFTSKIIFDKGYTLKESRPKGLKCIKERMPFNHPGAYISKNVYKKIGLYDISCNVAMDYDFYIRSYIKNIKFYFFNDSQVVMKTLGISSTNFILAYKESLLLQNKYFGRKISNYFYFYKKTILHLIGFLRNKIMIRLLNDNR